MQHTGIRTRNLWSGWTGDDQPFLTIGAQWCTHRDTILHHFDSNNVANG